MVRAAAMLVAVLVAVDIVRRCFRHVTPSSLMRAAIDGAILGVAAAIIKSVGGAAAIAMPVSISAVATLSVWMCGDDERTDEPHGKEI